jgi:hypothetical protein
LGGTSYTWSGGVSNGVAFTPTASSSYTVSGTNSVTGCSNPAVVNLTVVICAALTEQNLERGEITVYPNPNDGVFMIDTGDESEKIITVYDASGKIIHSISSVKENISVDISGYNNGIYFLRIQTLNKTKLFRILKRQD